MATNRKNEMYKLLHDAYYGDGQFYDGSALIKHARESNKNYARRKKLAYYLNYVGPIIDSTVLPVFNDEIKRDYRDTAKFKMFLDDVDRVGTNLQDFMSRQAVAAKLYGVVYILVNNEATLGESEADDLNMRALPFLTAIEPKNVTGWHFNERGRLIDFSYEGVYYDDDGYHVRKYKWTIDSWEVRDEHDQLLRSGNNNLKRVPIVQWFGRNTDPRRVLPAPEFISIAKTNYHIYHLCSLLSQISDNQAFNILTMQSAGTNMTDVTIGTNNLLVYPSDTNAPQFIAPDSGPAEVLMEQIKNLVGEMYRMSGLNSVIGVESAKSGLAKKWDFERTNKNLVNFAVQCEKAEKAIITLYEMWAGETVYYSCEYPRDFNIDDVADCLAQAQQAFDLGITSKTFSLEVAKKVLESYMPNIDPDIYDTIINELQAAANDLEQSTAYGSELNDDQSDD
ncbi:hypothetical protein [Veillonella sp.]|uniref:hypothetical protein n=1 Tax=Veillonella sp. TaxID=1926307 RepID=UPI0025E200DD|nr:hypothetical protein [Veillonella sp.]